MLYGRMLITVKSFYLRVSDGVGGCKENVRRNIRYLIELMAVRSLLEAFRGI